MRLRLAAAPLLIVALVAACSGASSSPATTAAPASAAPSAAGPSAATAAAPAAVGSGSGASSPAAAGGGGIALATTSLGNVLAGPNGMTLYMFTPDTSSSSACSGSCASTWPPLTGTMPSLGAGLTASDFGTVTRADGTTQISFHGHPLYYFSGDQTAGDTHGQGIGGKWYVLGADGNPMK